jgi:hypothetical protein
VNPPEPRKIKRPLREWEIAEARKVFGSTIDYAAVRVHEGSGWTDSANRLGMWLKRIPRPADYRPNAITLGNHCYFPIRLPETLDSWDHWSYSFGWVIHELTHAWQYQNFGWGYLFRALSAQFRLGAKAYDFGDAAGLAAAIAEGKDFMWFNPEQQGSIAQTFYDYQRLNWGVSAWAPFIDEIKGQT